MLRNNSALHKLVKDSMDLAQNRDFDQTVLNILNHHSQSIVFNSQQEEGNQSSQKLRNMRANMLKKLKRHFTIFEEEEDKMETQLAEDHFLSDNQDDNVRCFTIEDETSFPLEVKEEEIKRCMTMSDNPSPHSMNRNAISNYFNNLSVVDKEKLMEADQGLFFTHFLQQN